MDKYDLLVKLHQIQTTAISEGNKSLRDFIAEIFEQLTDEEMDVYYVRLGKVMRKTP